MPLKILIALAVFLKGYLDLLCMPPATLGRQKHLPHLTLGSQLLGVSGQGLSDTGSWFLAEEADTTQACLGNWPAVLPVSLGSGH